MIDYWCTCITLSIFDVKKRFVIPFSWITICRLHGLDWCKYQTRQWLLGGWDTVEYGTGAFRQAPASNRGGMRGHGTEHGNMVQQELP